MESVLDRAMELPGAKRYTNSVWCICPFHDDRKPSLAVYQDYARCSACGWHGFPDQVFEKYDVHSILVDIRPARNVPYIQKDTDPLTFVLRASRRLKDTPVAVSYLEQRGISLRAAARYRIGWYDGWVTIPVCDRDGNVLNVNFRAGPNVQSDTRFWQWPGVAPKLFVPDWNLVDKAEVLYVVFGLFDALTLTVLGYPACTSTVGKDSFKGDWMDQWRVPIRIIPDLGEEGTANKLASKLDWRGEVLRLPYPDGCADVNDYIQAGKQKLLLKHLGAK